MDEKKNKKTKNVTSMDGASPAFIILSWKHCCCAPFDVAPYWLLRLLGSHHFGFTTAPPALRGGMVMVCVTKNLYNFQVLGVQE